MTAINCNLVIVGGGIAGLWTLAAARAQGIDAILLEAESLGSGQTLASQGIIHGGSKYALHGKKTNATETISAMPSRWRDALNNIGPIKLGNVKILSEHQYLIPSAGIDSKVLSFFGSKTMASHTQKISISNAPLPYQQLRNKNSLFQLNEPVLAVDSIIEALATQCQGFIFKHRLQQQEITKTAKGFDLKLGAQTLHCDYLLLSMGEGFEAFTNMPIAMQKRPLHMAIAQSPRLPSIYAHFIGRSSKPLLTITSHPENGETVWSMGGNLAEDGVKLSPKDQQTKAYDWLVKLVGKDIADSANISSYFINRAEPQQKGLLRPDDAFVHGDGNLLGGWPTKLALAPRFSDQVLAFIKENSHGNNEPCDKSSSHLLQLPAASVGPYRWQP